MTHSTTDINCLDTTVYVNTEGHLESKLYIKPTDMCTLLHAGSFHPNSCKGSVIYSQALHHLSIITDNNVLGIQSTRLREKREYEVRDINNEFQKITNFTQSNLLHSPYEIISTVCDFAWKIIEKCFQRNASNITLMAK